MNTQNFLESGLSAESATPIEMSALPTLSANLSARSGESLRHILLGTPGGVRQTIHLLHTLRYVENALWSPLLPIPNNQLIITPRQGEVMSLLVRTIGESLD
ncbi:MAG: hypothetical protein WA883_19175 [Phormidesmis sp.]